MSSGGPPSRMKMRSMPHVGASRRRTRDHARCGASRVGVRGARRLARVHRWLTRRRRPGAQVDGLGIPHGWHPIWEQIMPRGGEPGPLELWFTPELQHVFETIREQMAEEEAARIAVEEERVRAEAEDALRLAEQQEARRKEEREAAEAQLRAWDEDAPRRVAALRARDIEEAPRIVDEEILQELHEREFQGMQRGLAMKGIEREQRAEMREKKMVEVRKRQEADISGQERTQRDRLVAAIAAFDRPEDPGSEESRGIQVAIATA